MRDSSLRETVKAFQAGSCEAFAELVGRYQNLATSIAFANSGDLQRSEDIAQQAFLVAWQKQKELIDPDRFAGWIRGIVTNVARNERRLKENRVQKSAVELSDQHAPTTNATPQNKASRAEQNELLWQSLNQIPLEYREPLVLFYREDLSVAAVAEQLELSGDAVKQRLSRGRKMLKQEIETMVEDFLVESKPAGQFTAGVIAVLPSVSATAKAAAIKVATAKAGQAALGSTTVGKAVAGTLSTGALSTLIAGLLGSLLGLFRVREMLGHGIEQATSEEEVREHKKLFRTFVWGMLALPPAMLVADQLPASSHHFGKYAVLGIIFGTLWVFRVRFKRRQQELHRAHGLPDSPQRSPSWIWDGAFTSAALIVSSFGIMLGFVIRLEVSSLVQWSVLLAGLLCGLLLVRYLHFFATHRDLPQSKISQHIQVLCRNLGAMQYALLLLIWATGGFAQPLDAVDGYSVWLAVAFIMAFCPISYYCMGYAAEDARRKEQGAREGI